MNEVFAKRITRMAQRRLSQRARVRMDSYQDEARMEDVIRIMTDEFVRIVWTETEGVCYLTAWDAIKDRLPHWTWRFVGRPTTHPQVRNLYHTCPHMLTDPEPSHLSWLTQEHGAAGE